MCLKNCRFASVKYENKFNKNAREKRRTAHEEKEAGEASEGEQEKDEVSTPAIARSSNS